jgi:hypothetical protein
MTQAVPTVGSSSSRFDGQVEADGSIERTAARAMKRACPCRRRCGISDPTASADSPQASRTGQSRPCALGSRLTSAGTGVRAPMTSIGTRSVSALTANAAGSVSGLTYAAEPNAPNPDAE